MPPGIMLVGVAHASAAAFTFTYVDGFNNSHGFLNAISNGNGTFTATSGSLIVDMGLDAGTYSLFANPNAPNQSTSQSGAFYYDNQLLPAQNPSITNNGLLFTGLNAGDPNAEINIFSNGGPNADQHYVFNSNGYHSGAPNGTFTLQAVPEPFTMSLGLASAGLFLRRRARAKQA